MNKKQKLELTWIGKDEQPVLEPRILIEDPSKSYGDPHSEKRRSKTCALYFVFRLLFRAIPWMLHAPPPPP